MALSEQIRKYRQKEELSLTKLARRADISKGYVSQLEKSFNELHPSADVLRRIATALGTSVNELLEKQGGNYLDDLPTELQTFALAKQLTEEEIMMLAKIEYRGLRPQTFDDWWFIYEAIKRSCTRSR